MTDPDDNPYTAPRTTASPPRQGRTLFVNDTSLEAHTAGPGSDLNPFLRLQGALISDQPKTLKSGSNENLLSSFNERFSYSYSISCDASARSGQFDYTNFGSGSTGGTCETPPARSHRSPTR